MIKEAIEKIMEISQPPTYLDKEGVERYTNTNDIVGPHSNIFTTGSSLDSVAEIADNEMLVVCSYDIVEVFEKIEYNNTIFNKKIHAAKPILPDRFPFGAWLDIESFIIRSSNCFVHDENYKKMIAAISSVTDIQSQELSDDGMSQNVTYKSRLGRKDYGGFEPLVKLRAYTTFNEIRQPEATYLIRLRKGSNGPSVSLHEASGCDWKTKAVNDVYNYIKSGVSITVMVLK